MPTGEEYRAKAAELLALALNEKNPNPVLQYQTLAQSYLHLAELAERNARADIVFEPPNETPPSGEPIVVKPSDPTVPQIPPGESDTDPDAEIA